MNKVIRNVAIVLLSILAIWIGLIFMTREVLSQIVIDPNNGYFDCT